MRKFEKATNGKAAERAPAGCHVERDAPIDLTPDQLERVAAGFSRAEGAGDGGTTSGAVSKPFKIKPAQ